MICYADVAEEIDLKTYLLLLFSLSISFWISQREKKNGPSNFDCIEEIKHRFDLKQLHLPKLYFIFLYNMQIKSTGLDKISARLLRECPDLIAYFVVFSIVLL